MTKRIPSRAITLLVVPLTATLAISCGVSPPPVEPEEPISVEPPDEAIPRGEPILRTAYVPAYSHLPRGKDMDVKALISILLSIRNVDTQSEVTLTHVDYFDTPGHRVRRYLSTPRVLGPLETAEFVVTTRDETGGSGANFLVYWEGPEDAHSLLTEAIMSGFLGGGYVAFSSRGVELKRRPHPSTFTDASEEGAR